MSLATQRNPEATQTSSIGMIQGRLLGGTSALNGMATLRGQPADYDAWADAGLEGWAGTTSRIRSSQQSGIWTWAPRRSMEATARFPCADGASTR